MKLIEVQSSNIKKVGYDDESKLLFIQYSSGLYCYENVNKEIYESLMAAESKGKFVAKEIKNKYDCTKVGPVLKD